MNLVFGEIELLIQGALFEQTGNPEKLEMEYEEKLKPMDEFEVEKGDEWKTKKGRIIFQERHRFMLKREVKVVFKPNEPCHFLQFKQYTDRKGAELKRGVSPDKLIHKLALEVNSYLTKPRMVEEIKDSISERERWGIKLTDKRADKKLSLFSNTRQNEKKLVLSLYEILSKHTLYIDSEHLNMSFFYIATILQACGINKTQHGLYKKYKDSIPID